MRNAPSTRPMISGRTYCTLAALCRPQAPAVSRRKQAMQKPMLAGLPIAVRMRAARPTATPARTTPQWIFFIFSPLLVLSLSLFFEKDIDEHSIKSPSKNGKWIYPKKTVISSVFPMILPSCFLWVCFFTASARKSPRPPAPRRQQAPRARCACRSRRAMPCRSPRVSARGTGMSRPARPARRGRASPCRWRRRWCERSRPATSFLSHRASSSTARMAASASVSSSVLYQPKLKRTAPCSSVPSARCSRGAQCAPGRVAMP